jgi:hypothetical protein
MMTRVIMFFLTGILTQNVLATAQMSDKIIYHGKKYGLYSNPLQSYFEKNPAQLPQIEVRCTALWRGYVATFEVIENELYVKDIQMQYSDTISKVHQFVWKSVLDKVFPNQKERKLDWFTGVLVIPHGKLVSYVHMGYASTYKKYKLLELNHGVLREELNMNHRKYETFKESQFQLFQKTDEYKKLKDELLKKGDTEEFIDSFLRSYITKYTNEILTE